MSEFPHLIGKNPNYLKALELAERVAPTDAVPQLLGRTGTGKEIVARLIHNKSKRKGRALVIVNCSALPDDLLESELFGYRPGAFTGASKAGRIGLLEKAHGGTLFLDEVATMSLAMQAKLLRAIEQKVFMPLGTNQPVKTDFRLISATNKDLMKCIEEGTFRRDFYYRISDITIELPPLRARMDDLFVLAKHFLDLFCKKNDLKTKSLSSEAMDCLLKHSWPGNIRELRSVCIHGAVISEGRIIKRKDLPNYIAESQEPSRSLDENKLGRIRELLDQGYTIKEIEKGAVKLAWSKYHGNKSKASRYIGMDSTTFDRWLKKFGLLNAILDN